MRAIAICVAIALAVSVLLAIVYSSRAAVSSFERVVGVFNTERNALVRAPYGQDLSLAAPQLLPFLAQHANLTVGSEYLASIIEPQGYRDITLLAIDMLASFDTSQHFDQSKNDYFDVYTSARTRAQLGLGDTIKLAINDHVSSFNLHSIEPSQVLSDGVLVVDIATAAQLIGPDFKLQFVALEIQPDQLEQLRPEIKRLAPTFTLEEPHSRTSKARTLYAAFELNIMMMVLVAFMVTVFTIYTSALLVATRRQQEVAIMRTLGFSSKQILNLLLCEALLIGALGGVLGALLGRPLTRWTADSILHTASSLYSSGAALLAPATNSLWLDLPIALVAGAATAFCGFLVPTLRCAAEAPALSSRRQVEHYSSAKTSLLFGAGSIILVLAFEYAARAAGQVALGYVAAMFLFVATFLLARPLLAAILRLVPRGGMRLMMACSFVRLNLRASAVAVIAGASAATLLVGLGVLIESFDFSLNRWMATSLQADAYLRAAAMHDSSRPVRLSDDVLKWLAGRGEIVDMLTSSTIAQEVNRSALRLEGTQLQRALARNKYQLISSSGQLGKINPSQAAIISESAARALGIKVGESVTISNTTLLVSAIFRDYTSERGLIVVDRDVYQRISGDTEVEAVAIYLGNPAAVTQLKAALLKEFPGRAFTFLSNYQLRDLVGVIFQQTFSITAIVRVLVMLICAAGFWLLRLQRIWLARREISTLSYLGVTRREFFSIAAIEGLLLAASAGILGIFGGLCLAWILVCTINPLSFGWTLDFEVSSAALLVPLVLLVVASLVAALTSARFEVAPGAISDE